MNDAEKLAVIRALCDDARAAALADPHDVPALLEDTTYEAIRAVLDAPSSPAPATPDRAALIRFLDGWMPTAMYPFLPGMADGILALVGPGVRLDRDKARALLFPPPDLRLGSEAWLDALEGCVVPAPGVRLTPDEAALAAGGLRLIERQAALPQSRAAATALAERLEREARG